jgi:hypothetical protein
LGTLLSRRAAFFSQHFRYWTFLGLSCWKLFPLVLRAPQIGNPRSCKKAEGFFEIHFVFQMQFKYYKRFRRINPDEILFHFSNKLSE